MKLTAKTTTVSTGEKKRLTRPVLYRIALRDDSYADNFPNRHTERQNIKPNRKINCVYGVHSVPKAWNETINQLIRIANNSAFLMTIYTTSLLHIGKSRVKRKSK